MDYNINCYLFRKSLVIMIMFFLGSCYLRKEILFIFLGKLIKIGMRGNIMVEWVFF